MTAPAARELVLTGTTRGHHKGLRQIGLNSRMLVQEKETNDPSVIQHRYLGEPIAHLSGKIFREKFVSSRIRGRLDDLPLRFYSNRLPVLWSAGLLPNNVGHSVAAQNPDLIHLHWVCRGFVPIRALGEFRRPIVWQLADQWAFTGGCHYSQGCQRYRDLCGACHELSSDRDNDLSRRVLSTKKKHWQNLNLTIVAQSRWMRDCARDSSLFRNLRVEMIPGGLDLERFRPMDKTSARSAEGLSQENKIILAGAVEGSRDQRKGFTYLTQALQLLAKVNGLKDKPELLVFGGNEPNNAPDMGIDVTYLGFVSEETLIRLYSAADVYVAPSLEEGFGQTALEAMACGTPCVAFDLGGFRDTIVHRRTGYLARPLNARDLADGIAWIVNDDGRAQALGNQARKRTELEYDIQSVCRRYADLYEDLLAHR